MSRGSRITRPEADMSVEGYDLGVPGSLLPATGSQALGTADLLGTLNLSFLGYLLFTFLFFGRL
jgi:hypothetical protein